MLLAHELRVGNLATDEKFDNQIVEIHTINRYDPNIARVTEHDMGYGYDCSLRDLNAIVLTPEILEKCGFENHNEIGWNIFNAKLHKRINLPFDKDYEARIVMPYLNGVMTFAKGIRHLHQLQNLYFALTGEELIINF